MTYALRCIMGRVPHRAVIAAMAAASTLASLPAESRSLRQVINQGTLTVGIVLAAPWAVRESDSGELTGFEIEVAKKLASDMGVEVRFLVYAFDELVTAVESGEIDIVAAGLTISPERALYVNFSQPYATSGVGIATNLGTTAEVLSLEDLDDPAYTIATLEGSVAANLALRILPDARLAVFASEEDAADAVVGGDADVYLAEEPLPTFLALENPTRVDVPIARPLLETQSAFAVAKGDPDFVFFLNAWITAREADTWLPTTSAYWFKSLAWRSRVE